MVFYLLLFTYINQQFLIIHYYIHFNLLVHILIIQFSLLTLKDLQNEMLVFIITFHIKYNQVPIHLLFLYMIYFLQFMDMYKLKYQQMNYLQYHL